MLASFLLLALTAHGPAPKPIVVSIHRSTSEDLLGGAKDRFQNSFNPELLRKAIAPIAEGHTEPKSPADQLKLEDMRRDGNILRSLFISLDARHAPPKSLDRFVTIYGKMNDAVKAGAPEEAQARARKLIDMLDPTEVKQLRADIDDLEPASRKSFDSYIHDTFKSLSTSFDHDTVAAPEFHEYRKELRHVMNVLQVVNEASPDPTLKAEYDKLFALNDRLGLVHDGLIKRSLAGKIDYDRQQVRIPAALRSAARDLMARFQNE